MKKVFFISFITALLTGTAVIVYQNYNQIQEAETDYSYIWKTNRKLPEQIAMDAYLASTVAQKEKNIPKLLKAYNKVLKKDPKHSRLLKDFYVYAQFNGTPQITLDYLDEMPDEFRQTLFSDYLKAAHLFRQNSDDFENFLNQKKHF